MWTRNCLFLLMLVVPLLEGCSDSGAVPMVTAQGKVDAPDALKLAGLAVQFLPTGEMPAGTSVYGVLNDDGSFQLRTKDDETQVPVGQYRVVIAFNPEKEFDASDPAGDLPVYESVKGLPPAYTMYPETPWTAEVTENGTNNFQLEMKTSRKRRNRD
ncbi:hypothetical protein [Rubinisphaera sp. JC750]|uniref:hypothetical protein n=1 Tax=Rubinisphaera sp. JC750 TaxID=2898658 RepID=UPI001F2388F4|nr:hypothetical protein [Rubinisphaera sp. JC750]